MFIYSEWSKFCLEVSSKYNCIRVDEIPNQPLNGSWISIKHDVETNVKKALKIAKIEKKHNIRATYFVQSYLLHDNIDLLQSISDLGHEVSYHYDVLDSNKGDMTAAIEEFSGTVSRFRGHGFEVRTVCPHGNPIMRRDGWSSNKDFFRNMDVVELYPRIFDVVVQAKDVIKSKFTYISDAGYGWKLIGNVDDNDIQNIGDIDIYRLSTMLKLISDSNKVIISSHPHRWSPNKFIQISKVYLKVNKKNSIYEKYSLQLLLLGKEILENYWR